jgi:undecaprenyl pyrophosphate phosphatase UppP
MKEQDLKKLTVDELKTKEKTLKMSSIFILVAMVIMLISGIFFMLKMKSPIFTILPVAFLPLVIIFSKQIKSIKEELEKRENINKS